MTNGQVRELKSPFGGVITKSLDTFDVALHVPKKREPQKLTVPNERGQFPPTGFKFGPYFNGIIPIKADSH